MQLAPLWVPTLAVIGAVVGSFLALVSLRWPAGEAFGASRSRCPACRRVLGARDLVPLASFLMLRGRCRTCKARIDPRYPAMEALAAGIGALSALAYPDAQALAAAVLGWFVLLLAALDLEHFWLPDKATYPLIGLGLLSNGWFAPGLLIDAVIGMAIAYLLFVALAALYRRVRGRVGLGGGDSKLFAAGGAWLGWQKLPLVLLLSSGTALVIGLILFRRNPAILSKRLPFGLFLAPAIWLLYLAAPRL
jgi:leader peptidase (prepilin peptidase)/N-methyltransferase